MTVVSEPFGLATEITVSTSAVLSPPSADTISIEYSVLFTGRSTLTRLVPSPPLPIVYTAPATSFTTTPPSTPTRRPSRVVIRSPAAGSPVEPPAARLIEMYPFVVADPSDAP